MSADTLETIRPRERLRVMDLVREAGIDVSDWANFKGASPAANPRYCYEWAFVDQTKVVVLNLWFDSMELDESGAITQRLNLRQLAMQLERNGGRPVWARRARGLDQALQDAVRLKLPVRVIVNEGHRRDIERDPDKASSVEHRMLDELPWTIAEYDWNSGDCLLVRGPAAPRYVDQFSLPTELTVAEKVSRTGEAFVRKPEVRRAVLARAAGRCEYCGESGFETAAGGIYLETHHVIPLSEDGTDSEANVVALCQGHHRQAHYGLDRDSVRSTLLARLGALVATRGSTGPRG
ncbi:HNH endonuclease signature motif containing protein [Dokdonella soli]|uniref:HNH nuclease domain-containing protein n=1 Tax=Dokdonella soli TaxID=529810 RepID=A0ABN1IX14_9GAMM